jgi:hypothetical protein
MPSESTPLQLPMHSTLLPNERDLLFQHLRNMVDRFSTKSLDSLLHYLEKTLAQKSFVEIRQIIGGTIDPNQTNTLSPSTLTKEMLTRNDLSFLCGYFSFLDNFGIDVSGTPLEIRIEKRSGVFAEGYLALIFVPPRISLLRNIPIMHLLWTQSEDLVNERFYNRPHGPYLCGSFLGRSKFFTIAPSLLSCKSKAEVISALGIQGYSKVQESGPLYVLQAKMSQDKLIQYTDPKVALIYKYRSKTGEWRDRTKFLDHSIPGFTSGGLAEIVGHTFEVGVDNLDDLERKRVEIFRFD